MYVNNYDKWNFKIQIFLRFKGWLKVLTEEPAKEGQALIELGEDEWMIQMNVIV